METNSNGDTSTEIKKFELGNFIRMETNSNGGTSTEIKKIELGKFICIRQFTAEGRRRDWNKCFPFNVSVDSPESNYQAQSVYASLLEDKDAFVNTPQNTEVPDYSRYFELGGNLELHRVPSETNTVFADVVIANDTTTTINDEPLESAFIQETYADGQIENIINGDTVAPEHERPEDAVAPENERLEDAVAPENERLEDAVAPENERLEDAVAPENERPEDAVAPENERPEDAVGPENERPEDAVAPENERPEDAIVDDDTTNLINYGASKSSSSKLQDDVVQYQNENSIPEDTIAAGNDNVVADDDDSYTKSDEERNLAGERPQKFRLLTDILKQLAGPCDAVSARRNDNEFSSETEDDSDDFTPEAFVRKKKGVRVTSKSGVASRKKKRSRKVRERASDRAKRMKQPVPEDTCPKNPVLRPKRQLRKTRTDEVDFRLKNKHKKSSAEIIVHEGTSGSQKVAPSSVVGVADNRLGTEKDSLISSGNKRNRETIQGNRGKGVLKILDGSQRRFTEGNSSRSTQGVKSTELVQPTIPILDNIETPSSGFVQKRIREKSPPIDNESMAALQLLRLHNSGVTTHTSSKTATKDPALSLSIVGQLNEESNVINGAGLVQDEQTESGTPVCALNMNPYDFSIRDAKKFMRRVKVIQK